MQSLYRLQTRVVFGFSDEPVSPWTKFTKIGFQKALDNQPQLLVKRCKTLIPPTGLDCPILLQPDGFDHALVIFCNTQIRFLLKQAGKASKQETEKKRKKKRERKYCLAVRNTQRPR